MITKVTHYPLPPVASARILDIVAHATHGTEASREPYPHELWAALTWYYRGLNATMWSYRKIEQAASLYDKDKETARKLAKLFVKESLHLLSFEQLSVICAILSGLFEREESL